jgi:hypothetical protein
MALHHSTTAGTNSTKATFKQPNKETLESRKPTLNIKRLVQHGHIVEIIGETEPGAMVMVNGERAPVVFDEGYGFKQFVGPLPDGVTNISITVQTMDGRVNTQQLAVAMP